MLSLLIIIIILVADSLLIGYILCFQCQYRRGELWEGEVMLLPKLPMRIGNHWNIFQTANDTLNKMERYEN